MQLGIPGFIGFVRLCCCKLILEIIDNELANMIDYAGILWRPGKRKSMEFSLYVQIDSLYWIGANILIKTEIKDRKLIYILIKKCFCN